MISFWITSVPLIFGELQKDNPISQKGSTISDDVLRVGSINVLDNFIKSNNDSNYDKFLTTQSHGLIKNKDIGVLVYTHGNPKEPHNEDMMKTELIEIHFRYDNIEFTR